MRDNDAAPLLRAAHVDGRGPCLRPLARSRYEALSEFVYLNQASLGLIPRESVDAMERFMRDVAQYGNVRM